MNSLRLMSIIIFVLIIFIITYLIVELFKLIQRIRRRSIDKRDLKQIEMMDKMLKPAEISLKVVINILKENISKYIYAFYTGNISNLKDTVSPSIYTDIIKKKQRYDDMGIKIQIINYILDKNLSVKQDNSSIYTVSALDVTFKYSIEFYMEHTTFKKKINKTVEQYMHFIGTNNDGWKLDSTGKEQILDYNEIDVY